MRAWLLLIAAVTMSCVALSALHAPSPALFGGLVGSLGVAVGAEIGWGALRGIGWQWPIVVAAVVATLVLSFVAGLPLRRVGASDVTAAFASVPPWVQAAGFIVIGVQVGLRFTVESLREIGRMLPVAFVGIVVTVLGCAAIGAALALLPGVSGMDAYLATTPGGLPAVLAASASASGNLTFITAVQVTRLLLVLALAPLLGRLLSGRPAPGLG